MTELSLDPISEAAVQALAAQGLDNYSDDSVDAVIAAVEAATANSTFDGDTTQQAVDSAAATAGNDPTVQLILQTERFTPTPTATSTATASATPSPTPISCVGDCNGSGGVTVDELLTMVNIALDSLDVTACAAGDVNDDGHITVDEILIAIDNALNGCIRG